MTIVLAASITSADAVMFARTSAILDPSMRTSAVEVAYLRVERSTQPPLRRICTVRAPAAGGCCAAGEPQPAAPSAPAPAAAAAQVRKSRRESDSLAHDVWTLVQAAE
jgi:hypothetical protein